MWLFFLVQTHSTQLFQILKSLWNSFFSETQHTFDLVKEICLLLFCLVSFTADVKEERHPRDSFVASMSFSRTSQQGADVVGSLVGVMIIYVTSSYPEDPFTCCKTPLYVWVRPTFPPPLGLIKPVTTTSFYRGQSDLNTNCKHTRLNIYVTETLFKHSGSDFYSGHRLSRGKANILPHVSRPISWSF